MIKELSLLLISTFLIASEMPPMPPIIMGTTKVVKDDVKKEVQKTKRKAPTLPKECEALPPMVIFLPPPMEAGLVDCKNALHKPSQEKTTKALKKLLNDKALKVNSIDILENFKELYKINIKSGKINKNLYCNSNLTNCFEIDKFITQKGKK